MIFGPEFIGRIEAIYDDIPNIKTLFYAGENRPSFAESYDRLTANCCSQAPNVQINDEDDAAIYFSSGTTGFQSNFTYPGSLMSACYTEREHHKQNREDNFCAYHLFIILEQKCIGLVVY